MALATPVLTPSASRPTNARPDRIDRAIAATVADDGQVALPRHTLLYDSFAYFMSEVHDDQEHAFLVEPHTEEWCDLFQNEPMLVLMAPRDHGKSVCGRCYMLWRAYRHNRDRETGLLLEGNPEGRFECVVFSETIEQGVEWFEIAQSTMLGNPDLFGDLIPDRRMSRTQLSDVWSKRRMRLRNGFEAKIRGWRTSTRGLHPQLLMLDDVLSDDNTLTPYQRNRSWKYLIGTLMPMNAPEVKIVGTALHYDDILHRLKPDPKKAPLIVANRRVRFKWVKYRSVNWDTGQVLWEGRHNLADLQGKRDLDALMFSREYQNDPRDDASSLFPGPLTDKTRDKSRGFATSYHKAAGEFVLLGMDLAESESVGADYTVLWVAMYDHMRQKGRVLYGLRARGMGFDAMLSTLRRVCLAYEVDLGVIEENGFQKWLFTETQKYPETAGRLIGHRTGREKSNLAEGVPSIKLDLLSGFWQEGFPTADEESANLFAIWQSEMSAFGWKDDKLGGVGEHDDTVLAWWFLTRAKRELQQWLAQQRNDEVVTGEEVGITRVTISGDY